MVLESEVTIIKEISTAETRIRLRSDGIVHVHYAKDTTLDIQLQHNNRALFKDITQNKKLKFLFTADEGFTLSKEAREKAKLEINPSVSAYAIVASNLAYRIIANFVLKVNRPKVPFKLFGSIADAVKWLKALN